MIRAYKIMNVTEKAEQKLLSFLSHNVCDNEPFKETKGDKFRPNKRTYYPPQNIIRL